MVDDGEGCCKLTKVAESFGISDRVDQFPEQWNEGESYRELALEFNTMVFRRLAVEYDSYPTVSEARELVKKATRKSGEESEEAIEELEEMTTDYDELKKSYFISYQTVSNHIKGCLGIEKDASSGGQSVSEEHGPRSVLNNAQSDYEDRIRRALKTGIENGEIDVEGVEDVHITVSITCERCGDRVDLLNIFQDSPCSCRDGIFSGDVEEVVQ